MLMPGLPGLQRLEKLTESDFYVRFKYRVS